MSQKWKCRAIIIAMFGVIVLTRPGVEKYGTSYQIALPLIALACSITNGQSVDFLFRYTAQLGVVHGSKNILGDAGINQRPSGGGKGMPSGHTATAVLGASYLVNSCIKSNIFVKVAVLAAAVFVGGSRVAVGAHDIWQVLAGAAVGWLSDRLFRTTARPLTRLRSLLKVKKPSSGQRDQKYL